MSNFQCPECGMINIDCGKEGYKTPREIELEKENEILKEKLKIALDSLNYIAILDNNYIVAKLDAQQALQKIKQMEEVK